MLFFIVYNACYLVACFLQERYEKLVELVRFNVAIAWKQKEEVKNSLRVFNTRSDQNTIPATAMTIEYGI